MVRKSSQQNSEGVQKDKEIKMNDKRLKVVHLNTTINHSSAPYKLHLAMKKEGIDSSILTMNAEEGLDVTIVNKSLIYKLKRHLYSFRRKQAIKKLNIKKHMPIDILPVGMDVSNHPLIKNADIICLHWINGDFLSPKEIRKLVNTGKPIYQFCHDNYPFTGGCHVRMGCDGYKNGCKICEQIRGEKSHKYIYQLIKEKKNCYNAESVTIVSPSSWMDKNITESYVFKDRKHAVIPNVIDTDVFKPIDKPKDEKIFNILCAVKSDERIPYNGMDYLWATLDKINELFKTNKYDIELKITIFGTDNITNKRNLPIENAGYIRSDEELCKLYGKADVFLITSLEDSFNQTAAECMACGTPVVAFDNGGIADIIDHKINGYLARYGNVDDLVNGLMYIVSNRSNKELMKLSRKKVEDNFSKGIVVKSFRNI